jgi:peptidoglycan hydrolase-like protein with peptidoglycan-binding domain
MTRFHALAMSGLTILGFTLGACDRRAPTADQQGKGYASTPATTPAPTPAPSTPAVEERQPVSGHDEAGVTTPTTDIYAVDANGNRIAIRDSAMVTRVQQVLKDSGMYTGPTDGTSVAELSPAIRQFQAKHELAQTGVIDQQTANAMGLPWDKVSGQTSATEDLKSGAKKAGEEMKTDLNKAGETLEEKTKQLGRDIKEGAKDLKQDIHEKTR